MAPPRITLPIFPPFQPEEHEPTFQDWQREDDSERWRGRASLAECPEGGADGAGGNADDSGDPIDTYHSKHSGVSDAQRGYRIVGPDSVTGKGSKRK